MDEATDNSTTRQAPLMNEGSWPPQGGLRGVDNTVDESTRQHHSQRYRMSARPQAGAPTAADGTTPLPDVGPAHDQRADAFGHDPPSDENQQALPPVRHEVVRLSDRQH